MASVKNRGVPGTVADKDFDNAVSYFGVVTRLAQRVHKDKDMVE